MRPDRGVVDQDVDAAELGQRPGRHRLDLILAGDVGNDGECLDPKGLGFAHDGIRLGLIGAGVDDDVRAFAGQLQHRRAADIAAGAGYQRDLPLKLSHGPLLYLDRAEERLRAAGVEGQDCAGALCRHQLINLC